MSQLLSVAASLPPAAKKSLAIEVLSKMEPISHLVTQYQVSRKFLYQQGHKANDIGFSIHVSRLTHMLN